MALVCAKDGHRVMPRFGLGRTWALDRSMGLHNELGRALQVLVRYSTGRPKNAVLYAPEDRD